MNAIAAKFVELKEKKEKALIAFLTAGYPDVASSLRMMENIGTWGADILEIGVPFSDPIADGPVIQMSSQQALKNGITLAKVFSLCRRLRETVRIPYLLMGYYNVMYHYGLKKFAEHCSDAGISGVIVPDLPLEESGPLEKTLAPHDIAVIRFVTPYTAPARIKTIAAAARGFVYFVSTAGVTGMRAGFDRRLGPAVRSVKKITDTPVAVGFGISNPEQAREAALDADGIIIGSYFIKLLAEGKAKQLPSAVRNFKEALK